MTDYNCPNCQRKDCPEYSPRKDSDNGRMHLVDQRTNPRDFYAGVPEEHLKQLGVKQ